MKLKERKDLEKPPPNWYLYQIIILIFYLTIGLLDSLLFKFSTFLIYFVHFSIRIALGFTSLAIGIIFIYFSCKIVFVEVRDPPKVIDWGIYRYMRHPIYLGILLTYLSFIFFTLSIISMIIFFLMFIVYNKYASLEEKQMELRYKEEYTDYKKKTPKWIPIRWL
jgi:protein-S-isoprenylcysteine O-methyltransferase Ste14